MSVLDKIYEAAFVPELWPHVLGEIAASSGANSGALLIIDKRLQPLFSGTPNIIGTLSDFAQTPFWYENPPAHRLRALKYSGFLERAQFFKEDERHSGNPYHANMEKIGADWQVGSVVDMPDGEMVLFTFERQRGLPDFNRDDLDRLDSMRPHLARASMLAARLRLERARASAAALDIAGIPACIVCRKGTVLVTNATFDKLGDVLRPSAFGHISTKNPNTDKLLQAALLSGGRGEQAEVLSFPIMFEEHGGALVIHVIPLHRAASEMFGGGCTLIAVTGYSLTGSLPSDAVLKGLFDLSAAEAGVAIDLAAGHSVKDVARLKSISVATVRSHLAQIFRKTGTGQQAQLISLLKGVRGFSQSG